MSRQRNKKFREIQKEGILRWGPIESVSREALEHNTEKEQLSHTEKNSDPTIRAYHAASVMGRIESVSEDVLKRKT